MPCYAIILNMAATRNFHVPLPESTYRELREIAEQLHRPATQLGREAIESWLKEADAHQSRRPSRRMQSKPRGRQRISTRRSRTLLSSISNRRRGDRRRGTRIDTRRDLLGPARASIRIRADGAPASDRAVPRCLQQGAHMAIGHCGPPLELPVPSRARSDRCTTTRRNGRS